MLNRRVAARIRSDPQFHVPERPRLISELFVGRHEDGLVFEGKPTPVVIRGPGVVTLLPHLLPLLDGSHNENDLTKILPDIPLETIRSAISLLYIRGLLEDGAADVKVDWAIFKPELVGFFRKNVDVTRWNRSTSEALKRLQSFRVAILGDQGIARKLERQLDSCNLDVVHTGGCQLPAKSSPDLAIVLSKGSEDCEYMVDLDHYCARRQLPWLRSALLSSRVEIGPFFLRGESACYRCFEALHKSKNMETTEEEIDVWLALLAHEIVFLASRICQPVTGFGMLQFNLLTWKQRRVKFPKLPGCPTCCPIAGATFQGIDVACTYEQAIATNSKFFVNPKAHQLHFESSNKFLQSVPLRYPSLPFESLPVPSMLDSLRVSLLEQQRESSPSAKCEFTRELLSELLLWSCGLREPEPEDSGRVGRWAPTAGNLGSVQIYALAIHLRSLAPGFYYYDPARHGLITVQTYRDQCEALQIARESLGESRQLNPQMIFVLTGALDRVAIKYGALAYRLLLLDAGVALAQLQAIARTIGIRMQAATRWHDRVVIRELGLRPDVEPITAISIFGDDSAFGQSSV